MTPTPRKIRQFAKKVHPIYVLLNWEWRDIGVPTIDDLEEAIHTRIESVIESKIRTSSGGIFAQYNGPDLIEFGLEMLA